MADNLHLSALRMQSLPFRIKEIINYKILSIANQTLVEAIHQEAILKKMPPRYIQSIQSDFDGTYLWIWVDFKGEKLEPLDEFFEEGTKRHFISPRGGTSSRNPLLTNVLSWVQDGIRFFSKGHYVSGIQARHVFSDGFKKGYPKFKEKLVDELETELGGSMLFGR